MRVFSKLLFLLSSGISLFLTSTASAAEEVEFNVHNWNEWGGLKVTVYPPRTKLTKVEQILFDKFGGLPSDLCTSAYADADLPKTAAFFFEASNMTLGWVSLKIKGLTSETTVCIRTAARNGADAGYFPVNFGALKGDSSKIDCSPYRDDSVDSKGRRDERWTLLCNNGDGHSRQVVPQ